VERESVFSWLMLTPPVLFLLAFLGYPFFYGVYLSFFRREVAGVASSRRKRGRRPSPDLTQSTTLDNCSRRRKRP
jgi:ABC-type sugar transport system permease subunit